MVKFWTLIITVRNELTKVMFLHLSAILFTVGCAIPAFLAGGVPAPWGLLRGGCACSGGGEGACSGGCLLQGGLLLGGCLLWRGCGDPHPPKHTANVADGTYPTGMHSCFFHNLTFCVMWKPGSLIQTKE